MKKWFSFCCSVLLISGAVAAPLFENGKTQWQIVLPENPGNEITYAASELSTALKKISGADFISKSTPAKQFNIYLGTPATSPAVAKLAANFKLPDANSIETVAVYAVGNDLYLAGNTPRAVLYSVYSFLQNQLSVRWLWPGDDGEFIEKRNSYTLPEKLAYNFTPAFKIRAMSPCHWHRHVPTEIWMARNFLNGDSRTASFRDKAGLYRIGGGHRVRVYNVKQAFQTKPEIFSLIGGRRNIAGIAGCWSNPDFTKQVLDSISQTIRKENLELLNLFPADITIRCECEKCSAQGSRTDFWYNYYSKTLIPALKKEFPKLKFAGIAYQEYRTPPSQPVTALEYVEYCHYNRCYAHKLNDPKCPVNARSMAEIRKWKEKAAIGIYGYEFDVFKPTAFVANWNATADAMRVYRDLNAVRVKTEIIVYYGKNQKRHELAPQIHRIANWMWAQLCWNPDADVNILLKEWCNKVYGPKAAPFMFKYLSEVAKAWENQKTHPNYFYRSPGSSSHNIFNAKLIKDCRLWINQAMKAAATDKRSLEEVKLEDLLFQQWENYYKISGTSPTVIPPYLTGAKTFDQALSLPLQTKKTGVQAKKTSFKVYWDDKGVHIQAICMEPDMATLRKSSTEHDGDVWKDDSIEIMVDTGDGNSDRHLVVTAGNNRYDAMANDTSWNPEWKSNVKLEKDRWIAAITLPFSTFGSVTPQTSWKFVIIRNSKPDAVGFPKPAHQDISSGGEMFFRKEVKKAKMLVWIAGQASANWFTQYSKFFFDNNWSFVTVVGEENCDKVDFSGVDLIYVNPFKTKFPRIFWKERIAPAVENGSTLVIHSHPSMLGRGLGDKSFTVRAVNNFNKILKPVKIDPKFNTAKHNLEKTYRRCGTLTFIPQEPAKWRVLMTQMNKDVESPAVIFRPMGKGKIFVFGQPRGGIQILENMYEYQP